MEWQIVISPEVKKRIEKIPQPDKRRILTAIAKLHDGPSGDLKHLKGSYNWRLRVGSWRIVMSIDWLKHIIEVVLLYTRGDIYKH